MFYANSTSVARFEKQNEKYVSNKLWTYKTKYIAN